MNQDAYDTWAAERNLSVGLLFWTYILVGMPCGKPPLERSAITNGRWPGAGLAFIVRRTGHSQAKSGLAGIEAAKWTMYDEQIQERQNPVTPCDEPDCDRRESLSVQASHGQATLSYSLGLETSFVNDLTAASAGSDPDVSLYLMSTSDTLGLTIFTGAGQSLPNLSFDVVSVPEPSALALVVGGLAGLIGFRWGRK